MLCRVLKIKNLRFNHRFLELLRGKDEVLSWWLQPNDGYTFSPIQMLLAEYGQARIRRHVDVQCSVTVCMSSVMV